MIRTCEHSIVEELAANASIPIINGLTDDFHPCQVLADLVTVYEKKGSLAGNKLAFVGDGHNMANSLLFGCAIMGIDCAVRSEEHTSELQSRGHIVCRLLLEKKKEPKWR